MIMKQLYPGGYNQITAQATISTEVTMNPNNKGYYFEQLPREVFSTILTYAINGDSASCLCSFQFVNKHWNTFIGGSESSKAWKFVCKQKFSGLFQFNVCTREDYLSLLRRAQPAAWIIQRAMCRLQVSTKKLNFHPFMTWQDVINNIDPCCICGVRWNRYSFERCEVDSCPFRRFLHCGARHGHYQRKEFESDSRLYVCDPCGKKQPQMRMGICVLGLGLEYAACFHCVQLHACGHLVFCSDITDERVFSCT